jgi:hypothetical protein
MKKKTRIISTFIFLALLTVAFALNTLPGSPKRYSGKIISINEGGIKDAVFELDKIKTTFYINRGYESFKVEELNSLIGKTVLLYYSDAWTPLDPFNNRSKNITKMEVDNAVFFQDKS